MQLYMGSKRGQGPRPANPLSRGTLAFMTELKTLFLRWAKDYSQKEIPYGLNWLSEFASSPTAVFPFDHRVAVDPCCTLTPSV